jgi:hypothetical protein
LDIDVCTETPAGCGTGLLTLMMFVRLLVPADCATARAIIALHFARKDDLIQAYLDRVD